MAGPQQVPFNPAHVDYGTANNIVNATMTGLAIIAIALRFWSRRLSESGLWWDDWVMLAAVVCSIFGVIIGVVSTKYGLGQPLPSLPLDIIEKFLRIVYAYAIVYTLNTALVKYSIVLLYWRIFRVEKNKKWIYMMAGLITAWCVAFELTAIFSCVPIPAFWNVLGRANAKCLDIRKDWIANALPGVVTDYLLLVMPLAFVWGSALQKSQKLALTGIFLLGGFVCIASTIRLIVIFRLNVADFTRSFVLPGLWGTVEVNIGIVSACLPCMRPILRFILKGSFLSSITHSSRGASGARQHSYGRPGGYDGSTASGKGTADSNTGNSAKWPRSSRRLSSRLSQSHPNGNSNMNVDPGQWPLEERPNLGRTNSIPRAAGVVNVTRGRNERQDGVDQTDGYHNMFGRTSPISARSPTSPTYEVEIEALPRIEERALVDERRVARGMKAWNLV